MENSQVEILLVDDNMDDAEMTIDAMRKTNLANKLSHMVDGEEALDFLFGTGKFIGRDVNLKPRLILLDLKMPRVDGFEVLRWIRRQPGLSALRVVVLTSSDHIRDVNEAYHLGANSFLVKPMEFEHITETIDMLKRYWLRLSKAPEISRPPKKKISPPGRLNASISNARPSNSKNPLMGPARAARSGSDSPLRRNCFPPMPRPS